jgi:hypothetical protein
MLSPPFSTDSGDAGPLDPTMRIAGDFANKDLTTRLQSVEEFPVASIELVECPSRYAHAIAQGTIDLIQRDLRLGLELDLVGHVSFFRRAGSFAHSSGKYTRLSNNV